MAKQFSTFDTFVAAQDDAALPDDMSEASSVICLATAGTPVIYVSPAFEAHTGYSQSDAVGRSLSFLQGPETEPEAVARFQALIAERKAGLVRITNYRRDGTRFTHICELRPIWSSEGVVTHFVAVQRPA